LRCKPEGCGSAVTALTDRYQGAHRSGRTSQSEKASDLRVPAGNNVEISAAWKADLEGEYLR
jgi:hypothetical protein